VSHEIIENSLHAGSGCCSVLFMVIGIAQMKRGFRLEAFEIGTPEERAEVTQ